SEEHTSELQSLTNLVCRLLLEKKSHRRRALSYQRCASSRPHNQVLPAEERLMPGIITFPHQYPAPSIPDLAPPIPPIPHAQSHDCPSRPGHTRIQSVPTRPGLTRSYLVLRAVHQPVPVSSRRLLRPPF